MEEGEATSGLSEWRGFLESSWIYSMVVWDLSPWVVVVFPCIALGSIVVMSLATYHNSASSSMFLRHGGEHWGGFWLGCLR